MVFLFSAVDGVEPQSETNWRLANNYNVPRIGFVNKMDRQGADFLNVCTQVKEMLGSHALPLQINIGAEDDFQGVVDLINFKGIVWNEEDMGMTFKEIPIPDDVIDEARKLRGELLEAVAEFDDTLMEKYFEDENSLTEREILDALRHQEFLFQLKSFHPQSIFPLGCRQIQQQLPIIHLLTFSPHQLRHLE